MSCHVILQTVVQFEIDIDTSDTLCVDCTVCIFTGMTLITLQVIT
jgi:hypothetical protein